MAYDTLYLHASSLYARWGFNDGYAAQEMLDMNDVPAPLGDLDGSKLLTACVRRFLLPALPFSIEVSTIANGHNPITAKDLGEPGVSMPPEFANICVEVPLADMLKVGEELLAGSPYALLDFDYEDLLADLVRYGGEPEEHWRTVHPVLDETMVRAAIAAADECPQCIKRFIAISGHAEGCKLGAMLQAEPN